MCRPAALRCAAFTTREKASALRQAEAAAKTARLRIWKNYTPQVITGRKLFNGIVSEVITGDTFVVRVDDVAPREERKIHLSSTRAPYPGRRDGEGEEAYGRDAKESLRKMLIGRPVQVKVDYQRGRRTAPAAGATGAGAGAGGEAGAGAAAAPAEPTGPTQDYATVRLMSRKGSPNVAALLISEGLATVRHCHLRTAARVQPCRVVQRLRAVLLPRVRVPHLARRVVLVRRRSSATAPATTTARRSTTPWCPPSSARRPPRSACTPPTPRRRAACRT